MTGHSGINNTLSKISNFYIWTDMKEDVVEYVSIINQNNYLQPTQDQLFTDSRKNL